jgi:hypothetical protein
VAAGAVGGAAAGLVGTAVAVGGAAGAPPARKRSNTSALSQRIGRGVIRVSLWAPVGRWCGLGTG